MSKKSKSSKTPARKYADIPDAAIKRLSVLANVKVIDKGSKDMARVIIKSEVDGLVKVASSLAQHSNRKTVLYKDLEEAVSRRGEKLYGSKDDVYEVCKNIIKDNTETSKGKRKATLKKKDFSGCVFIAKKQFIRMIKKSLGKHMDKHAKMSRGFAESLQHYVEQNLINIFSLSSNIALTIGGRTTVQARDMQMVWEHRCRFN